MPVDNVRVMRPAVLREESGYSLVEVLIAMVVITIGVLGSFALVDQANRRTADNKAREGATSLVRDLIESTRTVPFNNLTQADLRPELVTREGLADADGASGWQIKRGNTLYTVTYTTCTVDDASDRLGTAASHDASYCTGTASSGAASGADRNPADFMRIVFTTAWKDSRGQRQLQQSALVNSTYRGPAITALTGATSVFTGSTVPFTATLDSNASTVKWYVDNRLSGNATGSAKSWAWDWDLGPSTCPTPAGAVYDGTYFVSAVAYDRNGATGGAKGKTVTVNRCAPSAPAGLVGGRNWGSVELSWAANPEGDVVGYDVFRDGTLACSTSSATDTSCRDENAPAGPYSYTVVAYDTGPSGRRAGTASSAVTVLPDCGGSPCNTPPNAPDVTIDGSTLTITAAQPEDADAGDTVPFYRIYRTETASPPSSANARYDVIDNNGGTVSWTDTSGDGHHYWVTAVDDHYGESELAEAVAP
jgi:prepilin-type N-terminal cleavage/methylation domain-containing protein